MLHYIVVTEKDCGYLKETLLYEVVSRINRASDSESTSSVLILYAYYILPTDDM